METGNKILLILMLFLSAGNQVLANKTPTFYERVQPGVADVCIVSLGGNCRNSTWMKELNIRFQAFPFDWVESEEVDGVIDVLNHDFAHYLMLENLVPHYHSYYNRIRDKKYKINFVHDFSFQGNENFSFSKESDYNTGMYCVQKEYQKIYEKYQKRIARFRNLTKNYKTIIFMRTLYIDKASVIRLYDALIKLFGDTNNIVLTVVNDTSEFKIDWGLPGIKNFYLPTLYLTHDGYAQYFGEIIEQVLSSQMILS